MGLEDAYAIKETDLEDAYGIYSLQCQPLSLLQSTLYAKNWMSAANQP